MKRIKWTVLPLIAICLTASTILWHLWPAISGWNEANSAIRAIEHFKLGDEISSASNYEVNTFNNECSSLAIKDYYNRAAEALSTKSKDAKTYRWADLEGWDRVSTVAQTASGYVEVCASCNNDNDSISIAFVPGRYDKPNAKILASHELPHGILRCDWKQ